MSYREYLRWEGLSAIVLGLTLALVAAPGLFVDHERPWVALIYVATVLAAVLTWNVTRHRADWKRPGTWRTTKALREARSGAGTLDAGALKRRLVVESAIWIVAVAAWVVLAERSGSIVWGTGWASAAFGALTAFASPPHVRRTQRERREVYFVAERPAVGTPMLSSVSVDP